MFLLLYLQDGVNTFIDIIRGFDLCISYRSLAGKQGYIGSAYRCGQVEHRLPGYEGLFMIVLDLHIYNMYHAIEFTSSRKQI